MSSQIHRYSFKTSYLSFCIRATVEGLYALDFGRREYPRNQGLPPRRIRSLFKQTESCLRAYLAGEKVSFEKLPVDWSGFKKFEKAVLQELRKIPSGKTEAYQSLARRARRPKAARYVGKIMGSNRLPIIIPCHRILPKRGGWGGFSRGVPWKKWLLKLETRGVDTKPGPNPVV